MQTRPLPHAERRLTSCKRERLRIQKGGRLHANVSCAFANVIASFCKREGFLLQTKRLPSANGRASLCKRDGLLLHARRLPFANVRLPCGCETASFCKRKSFLLHARELPSACAKACLCTRGASFCIREGLFVHARELTSACEKPSFCMRDGFFVQARRFFVHAIGSRRASDGEGNRTRFPGRRESVSAFPPSRSSRFRVRPVSCHANVKPVTALLSTERTCQSTARDRPSPAGRSRPGP